LKVSKGKVSLKRAREKKTASELERAIYWLRGALKGGRD